ncbi:MAG TPA: imidazolonepropionase, partial [Cytophagales bacterium]|nr:imidazolonepropionase [Cytophagales bacterium]
MANDIIITNIKGLAQVRDTSPEKIAGAVMSELPVIENAFLHLSNGIIADYGTMEKMPSVKDEVIDASDRFVFPSFVDSHTHLVFAATREEEFVMKIKGATYSDIAKKGGGILNSAKKLRNTSEDELFERTLLRANEVIHLGTGAIEITSGYGL